MKKKLVLLLLGAIIILLTLIFNWERINQSVPLLNKSMSWAEKANIAQHELIESFWDERRELFSNAAPCMLQLCTDPFHYWWQAHALDVLIDGYARTSNDIYKEKVEALYRGILNRNAGVFPNFYYDDMEWMALAWLRAYDIFGNEAYKDAALILWDDIKNGWNDEMYGGIAWRKQQLDYKNTPSNAPAVILASRLYERFNHPDDLQWAKKIYEWQKAILVDAESGLVWDGINRNGDNMIDRDWQFTYGQGVYIGAGLELFRLTGDKVYLDDASKTAKYVQQSMINPATSMLPSEGDGDGALFKGILVRYLGELIMERPEDYPQLIELLTINASSLWEYGKDSDKALFSNSWTQQPESVVQMSTQLSGLMLLEQVAKLENIKLIKN